MSLSCESGRTAIKVVGLLICSCYLLALLVSAISAAIGITPVTYSAKTFSECSMSNPLEDAQFMEALTALQLVPPSLVVIATVKLLVTITQSMAINSSLTVFCGIDSSVSVQRLPVVGTPTCRGSWGHSVRLPLRTLNWGCVGIRHSTISVHTPPQNHIRTTHIVRTAEFIGNTRETSRTHTDMQVVTTSRYSGGYNRQYTKIAQQLEQHDDKVQAVNVSVTVFMACMSISKMSAYYIHVHETWKMMVPGSTSGTPGTVRFTSLH